MLGKLFADYSFSNRSKPRKCQVNSIETDVYLRFIRLSSLITAERVIFKQVFGCDWFILSTVICSIILPPPPFFLKSYFLFI